MAGETNETEGDKLAEALARARAEIARLEAAAERLTTVLAGITESYFALDAEFRFLDVNPAALRTIFRQVPASALLGRVFWDVFPDGLGTEFHRQYHHAMRERCEAHFEARSKIADRWFEVHAYPRDGRLDVYVRDITDRKNAELALAESEANARAITELLPQLIWTAGPDGAIDFCNHRWLSYTGLDAAAVRGDGWTVALHPDDRGPTMSAWRTAVREQQEFKIEQRLRSASGEYRWFLSHAAALKDVSGRALKWFGTSTDIEEQKRVEDALRDGAERLSLALSAARMGDWSWDAASDRVAFSPRAEAIFGLAPGAPVTWTGLRERLHADDRERARLAVERAINEHTDYDIEYRVNRSDTDDPAWVSAKGRAIYHPDGRARGMIGVVQDVTDRKRVEQELRESSRRKDEFLAMLAHELRNPLAPIRTAAQLLAFPALGAERSRQAHDVIERQLAHMTRLIDDLLDVSRISRGKISLRQRPLDFVQLVATTLDDHRGLVESNGLVLQIALPAHPIRVYGDPTRLSQVLGNLLHNAVKFSNRGGQVAVRLDGIEPEWVTLRVEDRGIGMSPAFLTQLFEPFNQADRSLDRSRGGLGLGLALVKGLVTLHGGRVHAASAGIGQGTTVTVTLPRIDTPPPS